MHSISVTDLNAVPESLPLIYKVYPPYMLLILAIYPGGGTRYVKVRGRLRGIDPPFSRHWEKI